MDSKPRRTLDLVAHILIWQFNRQQILLLKRTNTGVFDGHYSLPGGHILTEETPSEAAIREVSEEVGLTVNSVDPVCVLPFMGGANLVFETVDWLGRPQNLEPDKCSTVGWHHLENLPNPIVPWLPKALMLSRSSGLVL